MSGNDFAGFTDKSAIHGMAAVIRGSTSLRELNLSQTGMNSNDMKIIAPAIKDSGSLSKLKMHKYKLPVQEIKTATELDFSFQGLIHLDAIVIAVLIKVQTIQNHLVTN